MRSGTDRSFDVPIKIKPARWSKVDLPDRLYYLESCRNNLRRIAPFWIEEEANLRGHSPQSPEGAESWLLGPFPVARTLRYLINGVKSGGRPKVPSRRLRIDGRSVSRVFPNGFHEGLMFYDIQAKVWCTGSQLQGSRYRKARDGMPGPSLVLGGASVSSILATDLLSKLFCENRPVVCKIPPRLASLEPIYREVFHPLIRDHHLQLLSGDAEVGKQLLKNPVFSNVHLTGTAHTHQAVLQANRVEDRTFTAELGCVTPVMIVPGPWSQRELLYQARHLASILTINGGYTCVTPQILVLSKNWSHKGAFLRALRSALEEFSHRDDQYPGAEQRRLSFRADYPQGEELGQRTLVSLPPHQPTRLFEEESFCGMLGIVELEARHPEEFMKSAANFCNRSLWGDLSIMVIVDQQSRRLYERAVAQTIAALEYGTVSLNVYSGLAFASAVTPWGSYSDGRSDTGNGWYHNPYFFDRPEKTVMEGSFMPASPQPWVKPFHNLQKVGAAVFELDLEPSPRAFARFLKAFGKSMLKEHRRKEKL